VDDDDFDYEVVLGDIEPRYMAMVVSCWLCWLDDVQLPGFWLQEADLTEFTMDFLSGKKYALRLCGGLSASFW
jgi:hypothetical protein